MSALIVAQQMIIVRLKEKVKFYKTALFNSIPKDFDVCDQGHVTNMTWYCEKCDKAICNNCPEFDDISCCLYCQRDYCDNCALLEMSDVPCIRCGEECGCKSCYSEGEICRDCQAIKDN